MLKFVLKIHIICNFEHLKILCFNAQPGGLIKYQISTYLCCNPQDAFNKVEDFF